MAAPLVVVPPLQAVWLSKDFVEESRCVSFEAKASSDVTVIFKAVPGSRRYQVRMGVSSRSPPTAPVSPCLLAPLEEWLLRTAGGAPPTPISAGYADESVHNYGMKRSRSPLLALRT